MPGPTHHGKPSLLWLRVISAILLVTFCAAVAIITFSPGPPDPAGQRALRDFLLQAYVNGLPDWVTFDKIEFGANVLMFVPIGLFGALCLPRFSWLIVPAAVGASAVIESVQRADLPERVGTTQDVVANGVGALIGYLMACVFVRLLRRRARRRATLRSSSAITDVPLTAPAVIAP